MAKLVLVCPFCQKKLETVDANIGRDGQCPACEKIFEIIAPDRLTRPGPATGGGAGWLAAANEYEYQDTNTLVSVVAVGVALLLLIASTFARWAPDTGKLADYLPGVKMVVLAVSAACCVFFVFSAAGGKSLMPAVIVSGAWGTVVAVWTWGIWFFVHGAVAEMAEVAQQDFALKGGIFLTLMAGLLVVVAAVYVYFQSRGGSTFGRLGVCLVVAELVAMATGLLAVSVHVRPAVAKRTKSLQQPAAAEAARPAARPPQRESPPADRERSRPPRDRSTPPPEQPVVDPDAVPFEPVETEGSRGPE